MEKGGELSPRSAHPSRVLSVYGDSKEKYEAVRSLPHLQHPPPHPRLLSFLTSDPLSSGSLTYWYFFSL